MDNIASSLTMDKTAFSVVSLFDESDEKAYWLERTAEERLRAVELMRQAVYGYDPATTRLQRVLEITEALIISRQTSGRAADSKT